MTAAKESNHPKGKKNYLNRTLQSKFLADLKKKKFLAGLYPEIILSLSVSFTAFLC